MAMRMIPAPSPRSDRRAPWTGTAMAVAGLAGLAACRPMMAGPARAPAPAPAPQVAPAAYRALGTEPFWTLELTGDRFVFRTPERPDGASGRVTGWAEHPDARAVTGVASDGRAMRLATRRATCSDGMSDRLYADTASLRIGERELTGCGGDTSP